MNTTTLKDGIKAMCASLGAKESNTTNGGVMLVNTSTGEPNGMMTMANRASVLGALGAADNRITTGDLDTIDTQGKYMIYAADASKVANLPLPNGAYRVIVLRIEYWVIQFAMMADESDSFYYRRFNAGVTGKSWRKITTTSV